MLTIRNYFKLCGKPIGTDGFTIEYASELDDYYEIKLIHPNRFSVKMRLARNIEELCNGDGEAYYFSYPSGTKTHVCVTADYIEDINNMLTELENFIC